MMLKHLMWDSPTFLAHSTQMLEMSLKNATAQEVDHVFGFIEFGLTLRDPLQGERRGNFLTIVCNFAKQMLHEKCLRMIAFMAYHICKLTLDPLCDVTLPWFRANPVGQETTKQLLDWQILGPFGDQSGTFLRFSPEIPLTVNKDDPWYELVVDGLKHILSEKDGPPSLTGYNLKTTPPESLVGKRVEVWFHQYKRTYLGMVERYQKE